MNQPPLPNPANLAFVEAMHMAFLRDPASVLPMWRDYFEGLGREGGAQATLQRSLPDHAEAVTSPPSREAVADQQDRVTQLIHAYLVRGHMVSAIDPLGSSRPMHPELEPAFYGFTETDLDRRFSTHGIPEAGFLTLREILDHLQTTYCRSIGVEFMHIDNQEQRGWLRDRMERTRNRIHLKRDEQLRILTRLTDAVIFEEFIQLKYPGAKSFSLEGAESLIPLVDLAIETAGIHGLDEIVLAMAHRGRLNVLANIVGKPPREIFHEFEDEADPLHEGRGDVK